MPEKDHSAAELREIILGLKMTSMSFIEEDVRTDLEFLVNDLPSAEELDSIGSDQLTRKNIARQIGEIMAFMDSHRKQTGEYKARYEAKRGIPPRHKSLEWRNKVKQTAMAESLVKVSGILDQDGHLKDSKFITFCARKALREDLTAKDVKEIESRIIEAGYSEDANIFQEAGIGDWGRNIKEKAGSWVANQDGLMQAGWPTQIYKQINTSINAFVKNRNTDLFYSDIKSMQKWISKIEKAAAGDPNTRNLLQQYSELIVELEQSLSTMASTVNEQFDQFAQEKLSQLNQIAGIEEDPIPEETEGATIEEAETPAEMPAEMPVIQSPDATSKVPFDPSVATPPAETPSTPPAVGPEGFPEPIFFDLNALTKEQLLEIQRQLNNVTASARIKFYRFAALLDRNMQAWIDQVKSNPEWVSALNTSLPDYISAAPAPAAPAPAAPAPAAPLSDATADTITGTGKKLKEDLDLRVSELAASGLSPEQIVDKVSGSGAPTNHIKYRTQYLREYLAANLTPAVAPEATAAWNPSQPITRNNVGQAGEYVAQNLSEEHKQALATEFNIQDFSTDANPSVIQHIFDKYFNLKVTIASRKVFRIV